MDRRRTATVVRSALVLAGSLFLAGCGGNDAVRPSRIAEHGKEAVTVAPKGPEEAPKTTPGATGSSRARRAGFDAETKQRLADLRYVGERFVAGIVVRPAELLATPAGSALRKASGTAGAVDWPGADLFAPLVQRTGLDPNDIDVAIRLTDIEQLKAYALRAEPAPAAEGVTRPEVPPEVVEASKEQKRRERERVCQPTFVVRTKNVVDRQAILARFEGFKERTAREHAFWESEDGECLAIPDDRVLVLARKEALLDALEARDPKGRLSLALATAGRHHVVCGADVEALSTARMLRPLLHTLPATLLVAATYGEQSNELVAAFDLAGPNLASIRLHGLPREAAGTVRAQLEGLVLKAKADFAALAKGGEELPPLLRALEPVLVGMLSSASVMHEGDEVELAVAAPESWSRLPELVEQWTTGQPAAADGAPAVTTAPAAVETK